MRAVASVGAAFLAAGLLAATCDDGHAAVLYDGALGTLPASQGWLYGANPLGSAVQSVGGGATTLDTAADNGISAGYSAWLHPLLPTLDRTAGYRVVLDLQLLAEDHAGSDKNSDAIDDRAGLSVTVLSADLWGIELGFWSDEIWRQDAMVPLFTHAEGASQDTVSALVRYELTVHGSQYRLEADGTEILSGVLRNYSSFGAPYNLPNFLFIGDNTTSAGGEFRQAYVEVAEVPEPASLLYAAWLAGALGWIGRRARR